MLQSSRTTGLVEVVEAGDPATPSARRHARQVLRQDWSLRTRNRALLTAIAARHATWVRWLVPLADPRQRQALRAAIAAADPAILKIVLGAVPDQRHATLALVWAARDAHAAQATRMMTLLLPHADTTQAWRRAVMSRDPLAMERLLPHAPLPAVEHSMHRLVARGEMELAANLAAWLRHRRQTEKKRSPSRRVGQR